MLVKAKLKFSHIDKVDDNNKYSTAFFCEDKKQEQELIELIETSWESEKGTHSKAPKSLSYNDYENPENSSDPDNGRIIFNASQNAQSADGKYTFKVDVYDSDAKLIDQENVPAIGWDTIANLHVTTYVWTYKKDKGVKLNLEALQILDLVEYSGANPFEAQEEGNYKVPTNPFTQKTEAPEVAGV